MLITCRNKFFDSTTIEYAMKLGPISLLGKCVEDKNFARFGKRSDWRVFR